MIILLTTIFILSFFLFIFYIKISVKFKLIDQPNNLNVHRNNIPTGAGIIFLIIFYFFLIIYKSFIQVDLFLLQKNLFILIGSLTFLSLISFYDDVYDIHPIIRLFFQATTIFFCTSLFNLELVTLSIKI